MHRTTFVQNTFTLIPRKNKANFLPTKIFQITSAKKKREIKNKKEIYSVNNSTTRERIFYRTLIEQLNKSIARAATNENRNAEIYLIREGAKGSDARVPVIFREWAPFIRKIYTTNLQVEGKSVKNPLSLRSFLPIPP